MGVENLGQNFEYIFQILAKSISEVMKHLLTGLRALVDQNFRKYCQYVDLKHAASIHIENMPNEPNTMNSSLLSVYFCSVIGAKDVAPRS